MSLIIIRMILSFIISYPPKLWQSKHSEYSYKNSGTKNLYNRNRFEDGDMNPNEELKEGSISSNVSSNNPQEVQVFKPFTWRATIANAHDTAAQLQKLMVRLVLKGTDLLPEHTRNIALHTVLIIVFGLIYLFFCLFTSNYALIFIIISGIVVLVYLGCLLRHYYVTASTSGHDASDSHDGVAIGSKVNSNNRFLFSLYPYGSDRVADSGVTAENAGDANESAVIDIGETDDAISKYDESEMLSIASDSGTNPSTRRTVVRRRTTLSVSTEELGSDDSDDDDDEEEEDGIEDEDEDDDDDDDFCLPLD